MQSVTQRVPVWLDCDPGHDDAMAIKLAGCHPEIELLGISTVSGNQDIEKVTTNALQVVTYAGLENVEVYEGVGKPLIAETRHVPEIQGESGMDLEKKDSTASDFNLGIQITQTKNPKNALFALQDAIVENPGSIVKVICTGPLTNLALFVSIFPDLIDRFEVICMGGSIGIGNMPLGAEFNFFSDPHAAKIVFKSGVRLTMIPLEVTHLALLTPEVHTKMFPEGTNTHFQTFVSRLLLYFTKSIKEIYAVEYPAIHDPCAVYYVIRPEQFESMHVEIETESPGCFGRSTCDVYGLSGLLSNCIVGTSMKAEQFWDSMIEAVDRANNQSPLNPQWTSSSFLLSLKTCKAHHLARVFKSLFSPTSETVLV